eukprot:1182519-Prorocentrum_minimum.AAC.2
MGSWGSRGDLDIDHSLRSPLPPLGLVRVPNAPPQLLQPREFFCGQRRKLPCPYGRVVGSPRWAAGVPGEPRGHAVNADWSPAAPLTVERALACCSKPLACCSETSPPSPPVFACRCCCGPALVPPTDASDNRENNRGRLPSPSPPNASAHSWSLPPTGHSWSLEPLADARSLSAGAPAGAALASKYATIIRPSWLGSSSLFAGGAAAANRGWASVSSDGSSSRASAGVCGPRTSDGLLSFKPGWPNFRKVRQCSGLAGEPRKGWLPRLAVRPVEGARTGCQPPLGSIPAVGTWGRTGWRPPLASIPAVGLRKGSLPPLPPLPRLAKGPTGGWLRPLAVCYSELCRGLRQGWAVRRPPDSPSPEPRPRGRGPPDPRGSGLGPGPSGVCLDRHSTPPGLGSSLRARGIVR